MAKLYKFMFVQETDQGSVRRGKEERINKLLNTRLTSESVQKLGRADMAHFGIACQLVRTATCMGWHSSLSPGLSTSTQALTVGIKEVTQSQLVSFLCHGKPTTSCRVRHSHWHPLLPIQVWTHRRTHRRRGRGLLEWHFQLFACKSFSWRKNNDLKDRTCCIFSFSKETLCMPHPHKSQ